MSYALKGRDSDVTVIDRAGHIECVNCTQRQGRTAVFHCTDDVLRHLRMHRLTGEKVPDRTFASLERDRGMNDSWMRHPAGRQL